MAVRLMVLNINDVAVILRNIVIYWIHFSVKMTLGIILFDLRHI